MTLKRLLDLELEIAERKDLLEKLTHDHWLYDMQKKTLDDRKREYAYLLDVYEHQLTGRDE